jgi:hypothetical protein
LEWKRSGSTSGGQPGRWVFLEIGIGISDGREGLFPVFFSFLFRRFTDFDLFCKGRWNKSVFHSSVARKF